MMRYQTLTVLLCAALPGMRAELLAGERGLPLDRLDVFEKVVQSETDLLPADPQANGRFGYCSGVSGDTLVIGAFATDGRAAQSGAAYVFARSNGTWVQQAKLEASDGQPDDWFGTSCGISGSTIVIGAPQVEAADGSIPGAVYVFERTGQGWVEQAKLMASRPRDGAEFGGDLGVAISGNTIVVGAAGDFTAPQSRGAAYVFERNGHSWKQTGRLTETDGSFSDSFASAVAIDGNTIVAGDPSAASGGSQRGAAYVFQRQSGEQWVRQARLQSPRAIDLARFGAAAGVSGNTIVVGAISESSHPNGFEGAAYVFEHTSSGWQLSSRLIPGDPAIEAGFGGKLSIAGDSILIAAQNHNTAAHRGAGTAYIFRRSSHSWHQTAELTGDESAPFAQFGCSVATDGQTFVSGAAAQNTRAGEAAGEAYVFRFQN